MEKNIEIGNLGVKKFRSILRKAKESTKVYMVHNMNSFDKLDSKLSRKPKNLKLQQLLQKYDSVFVDDLPNGLPPVRYVDHEINIKENSTPPYRQSYQVSPAELKATKEYIAKHLKSRNVRSSKSPYGSLLFFC